MAFAMTIKDRISFGNMKLRIYDITDAQSAGSTFDTGLSTVLAVKAINNSSSGADHFKESVGADSAANTRAQVTFTPASNNYDGTAWIWGR